MTDTSPVSLATLITPSKTVSIDFPGCPGMTVDLCYLGREEMLKLRKKCTKTKFNKTTRLPEETFDEDVFLPLYCSSVIKGWIGLKIRYLEELLLADTADLDPDSMLPFTPENAELLLKNSNIFDQWVTDSAGDLENFSPNR